jgi:hypothetical protein
MNTEQRARELAEMAAEFEDIHENAALVESRGMTFCASSEWFDGWAKRLRALSQPASAGEGFVVVPRGAVDLAADVAQDWLTLFPEMPGLEKYERFTYGPAVEQLRDDLRAILAAPTPPATAQEDGRDAKAIVQRAIDGLTVPKLSPSKKEYFTAGVRHLAQAINAELRAALLTSPDSGKEG